MITTLKQALTKEFQSQISYREKIIKEEEDKLAKLRYELTTELKKGAPEFVPGEISKEDQENLFKDMVEKNLVDNDVSGTLRLIQNVFRHYDSKKAKLPDWFYSKYKSQVDRARGDKISDESRNRIEGYFSSRM